MTDRTQARMVELEALETEELRQRAFDLAKDRRDVSFFWDIFRHLPHAGSAGQIDGSTGSMGMSVDEAIGLWRDFTGRGLGESEPLLRAAFVDYLITYES